MIQILVIFLIRLLIVFVVDSEGKITYGSKTESNVTIEVINEKPDLEKKVIDKDNTETEDTVTA